MTTRMQPDPITFAEVALPLHAAGYRPFPGHQKTKIPAMRGWPGLNKLPWDTYDLAACVADYPGDDFCCCIAVQPELVAVDLDIMDAGHAKFAEALVVQHLGATPLIRIGLAPKQLRVYRSDGSIRSRKLHPLEVFCGSGQFVAFGWHKRAGRPYHWPRETLVDVPANSPDIPLITRAQLERFQAALFKVVPRRTGAHRGQTGGAWNQTIGERLRTLTIMSSGNWDRAAAQVLSEAIEGCRNETMWAVVASAAGRGIDENHLRDLFDRHFAGWDAVTTDQLDSAIERARPGHTPSPTGLTWAPGGPSAFAVSENEDIGNELPPLHHCRL